MKCKMCFQEIANDICGCAPRAPCYTNYDEISRLALALGSAVSALDHGYRHSDHLDRVVATFVPRVRTLVANIHGACSKGNTAELADFEETL